MKLILLIILCFPLQFVFAQIPQIQRFQPISPTNSATHNPLFQSPTSANSLQQMREAEMRRMQVEALQTMLMHQQIANKKEIEYRAILAEIKADEAKEKYLQKLQKQKQAHTNQYLISAQKILAMAEGKSPQSVKRAVFLVENAFHNNTLSYQKYESQVNAWVEKMKQYAENTKQDFSKYKIRYQILTKFFSDTVQLASGLVHYPPKYDFDDPFGEKDHTKFFVTKLLRTNKGQCHSMPLLYKILAEEIGVKAYIAYSPSHSFIKIKDERGNLLNFETTNGHLVTDSWLTASGYIKREALQNRVYLDTLSAKATMLSCLMDLANGYEAQFGYDDLVLELANICLKYNANDIKALAIKSNYVTKDVAKLVKKLGNPAYKDIDKYPELKEKVTYLHNLYEYMDRIGFTQMSKEEYSQWRKSSK
ncbi:MAG: hypothetical protein MUE81_09950 [Thermoflexibacter sp.]|jgi:hypothetical protein|nr:hypothetical protein [Thermoflexibacter sp.]